MGGLIMAAGDITFYNKFMQATIDGDANTALSSMPVDFDADTINVGILTSTHTPDTGDATVQEHWDDVSTNEVATGSTYSAGGPTLANDDVTLSSGTVTYDADDLAVLQDATGFTNGRYAILYKDSGTPATSPLIASLDLGADQDITGGDLVFAWNTNGIFTLAQV